MTNNNAGVLSDIQVQLNRNSFGITAGMTAAQPVSPGQSAELRYDCSITQENLDMSSPPTCPFKIQTAIKCSIDVYYFEVPCMLHNLLNHQAPAIDAGQYDQIWSSVGMKSSIPVSSSNLSSEATLT